MSKLEILLDYIVKELVEEKDKVKIKEMNDKNNVVLKVRVGDGELGKVIGKNGIIASSIRGVMQAAGLKDKLNVDVEFLD